MDRDISVVYSETDTNSIYPTKVFFAERKGDYHYQLICGYANSET